MPNAFRKLPIDVVLSARKILLGILETVRDNRVPRRLNYAENHLSASGICQALGFLDLDWRAMPNWSTCRSYPIMGDEPGPQDAQLYYANTTPVQKWLSTCYATRRMAAVHWLIGQADSRIRIDEMRSVKLLETKNMKHHTFPIGRESFYYRNQRADGSIIGFFCPNGEDLTHKPLMYITSDLAVYIDYDVKIGQIEIADGCIGIVNTAFPQDMPPYPFEELDGGVEQQLHKFAHDLFRQVKMHYGFEGEPRAAC